MLKKILKTLVAIISVIFLVFAIFLSYATITDYKPVGTIPLEVINNQGGTIKLNEPLSAVSFNIGFCGTDKTRDFFTEGGKSSGAESRGTAQSNLSQICSFLKSESPDFTLLQEVDVDSKRSFYVDELTYLEEAFSNYSATFGINYKVPWVPVPVFNPMGKTYSGIASFSKKKILSSSRHALPGDAGWPTQLFELDRCFTENRVPVENGKELVIVNNHSSAYEYGKSSRLPQTQMLSDYMVNEYQKGNYVIVGGDWNYILPGVSPDQFKSTEQKPSTYTFFPQDAVSKDLKWGVDNTIPTNRSIATPYFEGDTYTTVIDGFLVTPNVKIISVKNSDLHFESSDHNPVKGVFSLK